MKLTRFGIQPKKLVEDGHITLDEVIVVFGPKKANGYKSNNPDFDPKVKMQTKKLYSKFYPTNEKITNNEFGHKLYWGFLSMHNPQKTFHGLTVATNHGRRPIGFTKEGGF